MHYVSGFTHRVETEVIQGDRRKKTERENEKAPPPRSVFTKATKARDKYTLLAAVEIFMIYLNAVELRHVRGRKSFSDKDRNIQCRHVTKKPNGVRAVGYVCSLI